MSAHTCDVCTCVRCLRAQATQVNISDGRADVAGTFIWSGFDYLGESRGWPQIAKPRGTIADAAGFTKESFYWLRQWWLSRIPPSDAGRPPLADTRTVFIVEAWKARRRADGLPMTTHRTVHVYTDAPYLRIELNGAPVTALLPTPAYGNAQALVEYAPGNLTAVALASDGRTILATHTRLTAATPTSLRLSLDAPAARTGTGTAVVADGEDVALVRVEVLDAAGRLCDTDTKTVVSFAVTSGEGVLWATANGDPADTSRDSPYSHSRQVYYGLARAVVRSSSDHASPPASRRMMISIDLEGGSRPDGSGVTVANPDVSPEADPERPLAPIVIEATAAGLGAAQLAIPLSRDLADLPLAVARRSAGAAWK